MGRGVKAVTASSSTGLDPDKCYSGVEYTGTGNALATESLPARRVWARSSWDQQRTRPFRPALTCCAPSSKAREQLTGRRVLQTRLIRGGALYAAAMVCMLAVSAERAGAQSAMPAGWWNRDIGSTGVPGSTTVSSGTWTLRGSGANIWGSSDELQFAYQQVTGDFDISVRVSSLQNVNAWSKAGLMVRESLNANARNAFVMMTPGGGRYFQYRTTAGGSTTRKAAGSGTAPVWFRLVRQGTSFTGYVSSNGTSWTTAGSATISMASAAYIGLADTSRDDSTTATAVFTNYQTTSEAPAASGLPAPGRTGTSVVRPSQVQLPKRAVPSL